MKRFNIPQKILLICVIIMIGYSSSWAAREDLFFPGLSEHYKKIKVLRVISADSLELDNNEKVRFIGLKALPAPENHEVKRDQHGFVIRDKKPFATLEQRAFSFTKSLLEGKDVRIELDKQKKDKDFYTLGYVFLEEEGTFVNAEILRHGYAHLHIRPPNMKYAEKLRAAYIEARQEKKGLHSSY